MDNTAALVDVITSLIKKAEMTPHGLAVEAGIPWVTLSRRLIKPGDIRVDELGRIAAVLGQTSATLLAEAERRTTVKAA
jgi:predicted transcriptional regulator